VQGNPCTSPTPFLQSAPVARGALFASAQTDGVAIVEHERRDNGRAFRWRAERCPPPLSGAFTAKEASMSVARITEISSISKESFQDAILKGIERANQTLKNVQGAWVKDQEVNLTDGKVTGYKVILKVTFVLSD
jgi:hypothetical protein